jgi:hypothetical protein
MLAIPDQTQSDLYERFSKVQKGRQIWIYLNPKSRLKLDRSEELNIDE